MGISMKAIMKRLSGNWVLAKRYAKGVPVSKMTPMLISVVRKLNQTLVNMVGLIGVEKAWKENVRQIKATEGKNNSSHNEAASRYTSSLAGLNLEFVCKGVDILICNVWLNGDKSPIHQDLLPGFTEYEIDKHSRQFSGL